MKNYTVEYYSLRAHPVAVVMNSNRGALQAWMPNTATNSLVRDDTLILDIINCSDVRPMSEKDFSRYCSSHGIRNEIPKNTIERTLRLSANSAFHSINIIPIPKHDPVLPPPSGPDGPGLMALRAA